ncbi:MAG TPA: ATP-dependent 6-phosphofructokinase [Thermoleophilia bacterium]|nr:ATP-dependent 6-phosphofructokinase [Thermoleophilia bacterium]
MCATADPESRRTIGVLTSGGDSPGMNAAVRAVARRAIFKQCRVIGFNWGFRGLMEGDVIALESRAVGGVLDRGGTFLGTSRSKEFATAAGQRRAVATLDRFGVQGLVVIGGDGSLAGGHALVEQGVQVVGVPATIDNDVGGTDVSIGFDTALNTVLDAIFRIRDTASALERVFVVEVMGRTSGQLALAAAVAGGADIVVIPEIPWDHVGAARDALAGHRNGKMHTIAVVAEGAASGEEVARLLSAHMPGMDVKVSVLGHLQRGGRPTGVDRLAASRLGAKAVDLLLDGMTDVMVGMDGPNLQTVSLTYAASQKSAINPELYQLCRVLAL